MDSYIREKIAMPSPLPSLETAKLELIQWIAELRQESWVLRLWQLKEAAQANPDITPNQRKFGGGKGTFTYVSPDFDLPLDDFKEYMP